MNLFTAFSLFFLFFVFSLSSQTLRTIDELNSDKLSMITQIETDSKGNTYLSMMYAGSFKIGGSIFKTTTKSELIVKRNTNSEVDWAIELPISIIDIAVKPGGLWVLGQYRNGFALGGKVYETDRFAAILIDISHNGSVVKMIDFKSENSNVYATALYADKTGNLSVLIGYDDNVSIGTQNFSKQMSKNALLLSYNTYGELQYATPLTGGNSFITGIFPHAVTGDGEYVYVAGRMSGSVMAGNWTYTTDEKTFEGGEKLHVAEVFVATFDSDGECVNFMRLISNDATCTDILFTSDRHLILTGYFSGDDSGEKTGISLFGNKEVSTTLTADHTTTEDGFIAKFSCSGSLKWVCTLNGLSTDRIITVDETPRGEIWAAGFGFQEMGFSSTGDNAPVKKINGSDDDRYNHSDACIFKLSLDGELLWFARGGGHKTDQIKCIHSTPDGVLAGGFFEGSGKFENLKVNTKSKYYSGIILHIEDK